jgi:hypothetical protein
VHSKHEHLDHDALGERSAWSSESDSNCSRTLTIRRVLSVWLKLSTNGPRCGLPASLAERMFDHFGAGPAVATASA